MSNLVHFCHCLRKEKSIYHRFSLSDRYRPIPNIIYLNRYQKWKKFEIQWTCVVILLKFIKVVKMNQIKAKTLIFLPVRDSLHVPILPLDEWLIIINRFSLTCRDERVPLIFSCDVWALTFSLSLPLSLHRSVQSQADKLQKEALKADLVKALKNKHNG